MRFIRAHPDSPSAPAALFRAATATLSAGNAEKGLELLRELREHYPKSSQSKFALQYEGTWLVRHKRYKDGIPLLEQAAKLFDKNKCQGPQVHLLLAEARNVVGDLDGALQAAERVIAYAVAGESSGRACLLMARVHVQQLRFDEALRQLATVHEEHPGTILDAEALFAKGEALIRTGVRPQGKWDIWDVAVWVVWGRVFLLLELKSRSEKGAGEWQRSSSKLVT